MSAIMMVIFQLPFRDSWGVRAMSTDWSEAEAFNSLFGIPGDINKDRDAIIAPFNSLFGIPSGGLPRSGAI